MMIPKRILLLSLSSVTFLLCSCQRLSFVPAHRSVEPAQITIKDLASILGVTSYGAKAHFPTARYAQLVATITDSTGKHRQAISGHLQDTDFRVLVLLTSDPKSNAAQRLRYSIEAINTMSAYGYIEIEPETIFRVSKTNNSNAFLYEVTLERHGETKVIHIELETSSSPFPTSSSSHSSP